MNKLLRQIQSDDIEIVYRQVTDTATIWAISGFIDQANRLLEKLWSLKIEHSGDTWLNDEGFQFLWTITGKMPNHIPFPLKDIDSMQAENWSDNFNLWNENQDYAQRIEGKDWTQLSGNDLKLVGIGLAYDKHSSNKASAQEQQLTSLKALDKYITTCNPVGYDLFMSLTCASIIAARNGLTKEAEQYIIKWGKGYKEYWANYLLPYLMRDLPTAKILLTGILAPIFELTKEKCENDLQIISIALDDRITKGQSLVYEKLTWQKLLKHISIRAIKKPDFDYNEISISKNWLGFPPAKKDEITTAETRLNIKLPKEYKDFLLTTNGFHPFSFTPTLLPVDKIDWLKKLDPQLVEIWSESMNEVDKDFVESFSNSILIGGQQEEQQLLLIPPTKNKNWECWFFASWNAGETKYANFRYYMENELQELETEE
ncbi:MAG TPA: SMI1/KNR4 family protein [Chitinophagales bacterium]|nr:SMI1/KNR4 family protein [Chitinophagales bacterium]